MLFWCFKMQSNTLKYTKRMYMSYKKRIATIVLYVGLLTIFLLTTNPNTVPLGLLAVPVVLIAATTYQVAQLGLQVFRILSHSATKRQITSIVFSSFTTGVFILQSIGGLTFGDMILLSAFGCLSVFYLIKLL